MRAAAEAAGAEYVRRRGRRRRHGGRTRRPACSWRAAGAHRRAGGRERRRRRWRAASPRWPACACRWSRCGSCSSAARCRSTWPTRFPMVIDPGGVHWRHDDAVAPGDPDRIILAFTKWDEPAGENFACDDARWETRVLSGAGAPPAGRWPRSRDVHGWAGLYEMTPDHNPVLGEHPSLGGLHLRQRLQRPRADDVAGHRPGRVGARARSARAAPSTSRRSPSTASSAARSCATARRSESATRWRSRVTAARQWRRRLKRFFR